MHFRILLVSCQVGCSKGFLSCVARIECVSHWQVGEFVELEIANVEKHFYLDHIKTGSPLVVFGLLYSEVKMSLANYALKAHPSLLRDVKSKDRLIFHVGFRRFVNQPIFSEHSLGDKQKVHYNFFFFLSDFIFKKTLFEKLTNWKNWIWKSVLAVSS